MVPSLYTEYLLLFGWNILVKNFTCGALLGNSSENSTVNLKVPPSQGVSSGLSNNYPNITAFHSIILSALGAADIPSIESVWSFFKSRISLLLAGVVIFIIS